MGIPFPMLLLMLAPGISEADRKEAHAILDRVEVRTKVDVGRVLSVRGEEFRRGTSEESSWYRELDGTLRFDGGAAYAARLRIRHQGLHHQAEDAPARLEDPPTIVTVLSCAEEFWIGVENENAIYRYPWSEVPNGFMTATGMASAYVPNILFEIDRVGGGSTEALRKALNEAESLAVDGSTVDVTQRTTSGAQVSYRFSPDHFPAVSYFEVLSPDGAVRISRNIEYTKNVSGASVASAIIGMREELKDGRMTVVHQVELHLGDEARATLPKGCSIESLQTGPLANARIIEELPKGGRK